jgi:hypothetical protein
VPPDKLTEMLAADAIDDPPLFSVRLDPRALVAVKALLAGARAVADPRVAAVDADLARQIAEVENGRIEEFDEVSLVGQATQRGREIELSGRFAR